MRKTVFLAFAAFLTPSMSLANEIVTASCPSEFPLPTENNKSLPLTGMEIWAGGTSLQEPTRKQGNETTPITGDDIWDMRCLYDDQHQITIEIPKGTLYCTGTGQIGGKRKMFCKGASLPQKPQIFIAQPLDYSTKLNGFGLRQTPAQVQEEAKRQGLTATTHDVILPDGTRQTKIDISTLNPLTIRFSAQTDLSVEIRQDFPDQKNPVSATDILGPRLFGNFSNFIPNDMLVWDRKTGVIVISQNWRTFSPDNYIRLIDDAQVSRESGQPTGYKKYVLP